MVFMTCFDAFEVNTRTEVGGGVLLDASEKARKVCFQYTAPS